MFLLGIMSPRLFEKGKGWLDHNRRAKEEAGREIFIPIGCCGGSRVG